MNRRNFLAGTFLGGVLAGGFAPGKARGETVAAGSMEEDRPLRCHPKEAVPIHPGETVVLANFSGGPGSVESIQLAIVGVFGSDPEQVMYDSLLRLTVDGTVVMTADVGTFFLTYGSSATTSTNTWITDDLAVTQCRGLDNSAFAAFRRLFIPYASACKIEVVNVSGGSVGSVYSQVQFRRGAAPSLGYAPRRTRLQVAVTPFTSLAPYASIDLLPAAAGRGAIDSIQMVVIGENSLPTWLEGNPTVATDGAGFHYGGTEDFFGTQYYGEDSKGKQSDSWGIPMNRPYQDGFVTGMYRFFRKDPLPFDESVRFTWSNGQQGEAVTPAVNVSALVFYYLDR